METAAATPPDRRMLLPGLLLAVTIHAFHAMAVVTVMPLVTAALGARAEYGALFAVYLLASLLGLVAAGRAVDRRGPALPFAWGTALFAAGLLGSGSAPSIEALLVARALEGAGGGVISNVLYASVQRAYTDAERPRVMAWISAAWVLPGIAGPPLAGGVASLWGWRWVFLGALPLALIAAALALPALRRLSTGARRPAASAPGWHALTLVLGVGALLLALGRTPDVASLALGIPGAALAVTAARRILPIGTLRLRPGLPAAIAALLLVNFVFFGAEAFVPLALVDVRGISTWRAGTVLTCGALGWTAGAFVQARLAARMSRRGLAAIGWLALAAGVATLLPVLEAETPWQVAGLAWSLAGFGMGIAYTITRVAAMAYSPPDSEGATATALGIADALGFSLAAGIGGAMIAQAGRTGGATADAILEIWIGATAAAVLGFALSRRLVAAAVPELPPPASAIGGRAIR